MASEEMVDPIVIMPDDSETDDKDSVDGGEPQYGLYPRRWWMMTLLSLVSLQQSCTWATYSPIVKEVHELYGWSSGTVDILGALGPIWYLPIVIVTPAIVERIGLRGAVTIAAGSTMLGSILRSLTTKSPYALILAYVGQSLNAFSGPFVLATPTKLSAEWFPPSQRTTATSICVFANYLGTGAGFLLALPIKSKDDIKPLLYGEALVSILLFAVFIVDHMFFDPLPPKPPSATAMTQHNVHILRDASRLLCNPQFMLIAVINGISLGTWSGWSGVLDPILKPLGFSQSLASWLGFAATVGCVGGGVGFGYWSGFLLNHTKPALMSLYFVAVLFLGWFALLANHELPKSTLSLFVSCTAASLVLNAVGGVFYELAVEAAFPIDEVSSSAWLTFLFNAASSVYMAGGSKIPPKAMNWALLGVSVLSLLLLMLFKDNRKRSHVDAVKGSADTVGKPPQHDTSTTLKTPLLSVNDSDP